MSTVPTVIEAGEEALSRTPSDGAGGRARMTRAAKLQLGLPVTVWVTVLGIPYILMVVISFWPNNSLTGMQPGFTMENWESAFTQPLYRDAFIRSLLVATAVTAISVGIGYPVAYFIATRISKRAALIYVLLQVPLWTAYLIRAYAWRVVLGEEGLIAKGLKSIGIQDTPEWLLFSNFAVVLVISTMFIPFVTIAIYPALQAIPKDMNEAAKDLGGGRLSTFVRITWPLSKPAVIAAATYTFAISFGDFISPVLVGGPTSIMVTQLIFNQVGVAYNWPLAAALGLGMVIIVAPLLMIAQRAENNQRIGLRR